MKTPSRNSKKSKSTSSYKKPSIKKRPSNRGNDKKSLKSDGEVVLHPDSYKYLRKGHPWVTKDRYSLNFPKNFPLIYSLSNNQKWVFLNDPEHSKVKARLWTVLENSEESYSTDNFWEDFSIRVSEAIEERIEEEIDNERENFFLVFSEYDQIPGLKILKLKNIVLIEEYANFWGHQKEQVKSILQKSLNHYFEEDITIIWTVRNTSKLKIKSSDQDLIDNEVVINEFGISYKLNMKDFYDFGIYTDMSSIREGLSEHLYKADSVLNLFCYTGAYSLYALGLEAKKVVSVDLSPKYLNWLQENLELNSHLETKNHYSIKSDTLSAIKKLKKENQKFSFIVCDPPSSFTDKNKRYSVLEYTEKLLPELFEVLTENGKIALFCNTHQTTRKKFKSVVNSLLPKNYAIQEELFLDGDCGALENFPESDYLKGFIISKHP
ncbi:MAG: class I SAM-dependent methyltransferase [Bacteriovoracaceae bacterium]